VPLIDLFFFFFTCMETTLGSVAILLKFTPGVWMDGKISWTKKGLKSDGREGCLSWTYIFDFFDGLIQSFLPIILRQAS